MTTKRTATPPTATDAAHDAEENSESPEPGFSLAGHSIPGRLPMRPPNFYDKSGLVKYVSNLLSLSLRVNSGVLVSGPIGIGKTTAVAESARAQGIEAVYVNMYGTDGFRQQMALIWRAMTGTEPSGTGPEIRDQILASLLLQARVLLIDDAHILKRTALGSIVAIYDTFFTARGQGLSIVLCGNNLEEHLRKMCPQLLSRCGLGKEQPPPTGRGLTDLLLAMEPRIAGTDHTTLRDMDAAHFKGDLRRWRAFFLLLGEIRRSDEPARLTQDEVEAVLGVMPRGTR